MVKVRKARNPSNVFLSEDDIISPPGDGVSKGESVVWGDGDSDG